MVQMILSASVMIVLAVLVRLLAIHRLPKRTFVIIWGLVSVRLLIPFSLPDAFSVLHVSNLPILEAFSIFGNPTVHPDLLISAPIALPVYMVEYSAGALVQAPVNWSLILLILWILGSALLAFVFVLSHLKFRRKLSTSLPLEHPFVRDWLTLHKTLRTVQVRYSDQILSPLTYGIFRPVIVLPVSMDLSDEVRLNYVLTHEHIHIRRFDYGWKLFFAAVLCVHWFNPLVWLMYVFTNRDVELSCDEAVLGLLGQKSKTSYGLALLDLAEENSLLAFASSFSKHALEERIRVMARGKRKSILGAIAVLLLITCTMMILAAPLADAAQSQFSPTAWDDVPQAPVYLSHTHIDLAPEPESSIPDYISIRISDMNQETELSLNIQSVPVITLEETTSERPPVFIPHDLPSVDLTNQRLLWIDDGELYESRFFWVDDIDHTTITLRAFGVSSLEELALYFPDEFSLFMRSMEQLESDQPPIYDSNDSTIDMGRLPEPPIAVSLSR